MLVLRSKPARPSSSQNNDARHLALPLEGITSVPERGELRADPTEGPDDYVS